MKDERGYDEDGNWISDEAWEPNGEPYEISLARNVDGHRWNAWVKWDGCIHFNVKGTTEESDFYLHTCDLDEVIKALSDLRDEAVRHYAKSPPGEWPGC